MKEEYSIPLNSHVVYEFIDDLLEDIDDASCSEADSVSRCCHLLQALGRIGHKLERFKKRIDDACKNQSVLFEPDEVPHYDDDDLPF